MLTSYNPWLQLRRRRMPLQLVSTECLFFHHFHVLMEFSRAEANVADIDVDMSMLLFMHMRVCIYHFVLDECCQTQSH